MVNLKAKVHTLNQVIDVISKCLDNDKNLAKPNKKVYVVTMLLNSPVLQGNINGS